LSIAEDDNKSLFSISILKSLGVSMHSLYQNLSIYEGYGQKITLKIPEISKDAQFFYKTYA